MKTLFTQALLAFCLPAMLTAARLFPCANYSTDGQPADVYAVWEIPATGAAVYFVHRAENSPRDLPQSLALRWRPVGGRMSDFKPFDRVYNYVEKGEDWMVFDFSFKESGIYECSTLNDAGQVMATTTITVNKIKDAVVGKAVLTACRDVNEIGDPIGAGIDFKIAPNGAIYAHFATDNAFNADRIGFEIWQVDDFGYETFLDTRSFECATNWNFFKMPVHFPDAGRFKIKVFMGSNNTNILAEQLVRIKF